MAAPIGLLLSVALVWQGSRAAFTAQTSNTANSFTTGTVALSDDDSGVALFPTITGMKPGSTGVKCILVTYGGSLAATVKLFVNTGDLTGTLGTYLNMQIEEGTSASFSSCAGFSATSTLFNGTLASLASTNTSSATGLSSWAPATAASTKAYRFTYTLPTGVANAAQGTTCTVAFTWEATNS